jgi:hypothetical protein
MSWIITSSIELVMNELTIFIYTTTHVLYMTLYMTMIYVVKHFRCRLCGMHTTCSRF